MVGILIILLLNSIAVYVTSAILPGVKLENFMTALVVAVVLGLINTFIRPIVLLLTLPINILTLGLFTFVIMGFLTLVVTWIVPGFEVANFWWAMLFALVLAIINTFLSSMIRPI
jgi:putative membrane protein